MSEFINNREINKDYNRRLEKLKTLILKLHDGEAFEK